MFLFDGGIRENPQILLWGREKEERGIKNLPRENAATECIDRECKQKRIREHKSVRIEDIQIKR